MGHVPLERALSKLGVASRTQANAMIVAGRVRLGTRVVVDPLLPVIPERLSLFIDDVPVTRSERVLVALHKPRGCVTTASDPQGRPTVFDLVADVGTHLVAVGRLDYATSGLLLLTNDTRLADQLTDPKNAVRRTYVCVLKGSVDDDAFARWRTGILDAGETLRALEVNVRKRSGRETTVIVALAEGKNREIRRLALAVGSEVLKLKRIAYGEVELEDLPVGKWRRV